ncbi:hypothetical protein BGZ99_009576, partial [Dissophora globulifera]
ALAKQFYVALVNAHVVQELDIALQWDVTLNDLWAFTEAVTKAKILNLKLDGSYFKGGPVLDTINRGRRYDPLLVLMSNMRIQVLHFEGITNMYQRLSGSAWSPAPRVRVLEISSRTSKTSLCVSPALLSCILKNCVGLGELRITVDSFFEAVQQLANRLPMMSNLGIVEVRSKQGVIQCSIDQGKATAIRMQTWHPDALKAIDALPMEHLATLDVRPHMRSTNYSQEDVRRLAATVQATPALTNLMLIFYADQCTSILNTVKAAREKGLAEGLSYEPLVVRFLGQDSLRGVEDVHVTTAHLHSRSTDVRGMSIDIHTSRSIIGQERITFGELIRQHGSSIQEIGRDFVFLDDDARILDEETSKAGSDLIRLELDPSRLSPIGLDCLDRVIARSTRLQRLGFSLTRLEESSELNKALRLLKQHGALVHSIQLAGNFSNNADAWLSGLQEQCPTMISASPQLHASTAAQHSMASIPGHIHVKSIKSLGLRNVILNPSDWDTLFSALNFVDLQELDLRGSNITVTDLELLVDRIPESDDVAVPLAILNVIDTELECERLDKKPQGLQEAVERLKTKAPLVEIAGIPVF